MSLIATVFLVAPPNGNAPHIALNLAKTPVTVDHNEGSVIFFPFNRGPKHAIFCLFSNRESFQPQASHHIDPGRSSWPTSLDQGEDVTVWPSTTSLSVFAGRHHGGIRHQTRSSKRGRTTRWYQGNMAGCSSLAQVRFLKWPWGCVKSWVEFSPVDDDVLRIDLCVIVNLQLTNTWGHPTKKEVNTTYKCMDTYPFRHTSILKAFVSKKKRYVKKTWARPENSSRLFGFCMPEPLRQESTNSR